MKLEKDKSSNVRTTVSVLHIDPGRFFKVTMSVSNTYKDHLC
jgi:hypothetical protein